VGDAMSRQFLYPVAARMLRHCDGVLRIPGPSGGADGDVRLATEMGLAVYHDIAEISVSATDADAACVIGKPLGPAEYPGQTVAEIRKSLFLATACGKLCRFAPDWLVMVGNNDHDNEGCQ
jgi:hypothetical protein